MGTLIVAVICSVICFVPIIIVPVMSLIEYLYNEFKPRDGVTITFEKFLNLYNVNHDRWVESSEGFKYTTDNNEVIHLRFKTRHDDKKYIKWKERNAEIKEENKNTSDMTKIIRCAARDIENYKEKSRQEIRDKVDKLYEEMNKHIEEKNE